MEGDNILGWIVRCLLLLAAPIAALFACNYAAFGTFEPVYEKFGGPWYNYEGSHWSKWGTPAGKGIDFNQEPTAIYAFHLLLGHHGWFSLTPIWFLALGGLICKSVTWTRM